MAKKAKPLITINGYELPCPSSYNATISTIVDSGRNVNGKVVGSVVRENVAAVDAVFNYMPVKKWAEILQQFDAGYDGSFYAKVRFYHPTSNSWKTAKMYVGDRTTDGLHLLDKNGYPQAWLGTKLSLVEK